MLEVKIDNILPVTEARDSFNQLVDKVESSDEMFVLTKNGKPVSILVGVQHLEKLTGTSHEDLTKEIDETSPIASSPEDMATPTPEPAFAPAPALEETPETTTEVPVTDAPAQATEPVDNSTTQNYQDNAFSYNAPAPTEAPATPEAQPAAAPADNTQVDNTSVFSMPPIAAADDQQMAAPEDTNTQNPPTSAV